MSFRKRNAPIADTKSPRIPTQDDSAPPLTRVAGTRASAVDGRLVTSTGTGTLDGLFAGHGGLPMGTKLLIEEDGSTDYAGALLRFYAAEGLLQGHHVHVLGLPDSWGRDLPGLSTERKRDVDTSSYRADQMKIAWRYEKLGQREAVSRDHTVQPVDQAMKEVNSQSVAFNHVFDLTKRLVHPAGSRINFVKLDYNTSRNPFATLLSSLSSALTSTEPSTVHRLILPNLLSPAMYPSHSNQPEHLFTAIHALCSLLASHSTRLAIMISLPTLLHPRSSGITKWLEILADGVLELLPFPHSSDAEFMVSRDSNTKEEPPQGLLKIHKLPVLHELGSGVPLSDVDWTFTLSRRKLTIKPFNLPPIEGDTDAQQATGPDTNSSRAKKADMEF